MAENNRSDTAVKYEVQPISKLPIEEYIPPVREDSLLEHSKTYPSPWKYVGSYVDHLVKYRLTHPDEYDISGIQARLFPDFITFLERDVSAEFAREFQEKTLDLSESMANSIIEGVGPSMKFFSAAFEPSDEHVERILDAREDIVMQQYIRSFKDSDGNQMYDSLDRFAYDVLTQADVTIPLDMIEDRDIRIAAADVIAARHSEADLSGNGLSVSEITQLIDTVGLDRMSWSESGKLLLFAADTYAYFYFNLNRIPQDFRNFNFDSILDEYRNFIASGVARPDMIGLAPKDENDYHATERIDNFISVMKGKRFGLRTLMSISEFSPEDRKTMFEVYELIRQGKVRYAVVEMKINQVENKLTKDDSDADGVRHSLYVMHKYKDDVAHTMWAIFQQMIAVYGQASADNARNMLEGIRSVNTAPSFYESMHSHLRKHKYEDMKQFIEPFLRLDKDDNNVLIATTFWPLFRMVHTPGGKAWDWNLNPPVVGTIPDYADPFVVPLTGIQLGKWVRQHGRKIAQQLSKRKLLPVED